MDGHLYVVAYDISNQRRWRRLFKLLHGYGAWLQLSVFQCRLTAQRRVELVAAIAEIIHHKEDHVLVLDIGPAEHVKVRVQSLGKEFVPEAREPIIV